MRDKDKFQNFLNLHPHSDMQFGSLINHNDCRTCDYQWMNTTWHDQRKSIIILVNGATQQATRKNLKILLRSCEQKLKTQGRKGGGDWRSHKFKADPSRSSLHHRNPTFPFQGSKGGRGRKGDPLCLKYRSDNSPDGQRGRH